MEITASSENHADPRLQLILTVTLVVAIFSSASWLRLSLLTLYIVVSLGRWQLLPLFLRRVLWLRWFMFFVLLLHAFFSVGHTLPMFPFVTYEGIGRGLSVCLQVLAALGASMLLTQRLSDEAIAAAFTAMLKPAERLGVDVEALSMQLILTLRLVPVLKVEGEGILRAAKSDRKSTLLDRIVTLRQIIMPFFDRLVGRAEHMAQDLSTGRLQGAEVPVLLPFKTALAQGGAPLLTILVVLVACQVLP